MASSRAFRRLLTIAVLLSLCSALFISINTRTEAATNLLNIPASKVSPDLRQLIASGNGDRRVKLIVQTNPTTPAGQVSNSLNTAGGVLAGVLSNLNVQVVDIPA